MLSSLSQGFFSFATKMSDLLIAPIQQRDAFCSSVKADVWQAQTAEKAYEWWYFDALSDDGREAVVIIFADNYVFSPRYAALTEIPNDPPRRFPAIYFIYSVDGKTVFRTINEFPDRQFQANTESIECKIGDSSFHVDAGSYGSGYIVSIDVPVSQNRRLKASFEWLSIEVDLLPDQAPEVAYRSNWNMVAPRSDVTGRIELVGRRGNSKKLFHFRGTGYHDHLAGEKPLYDSIRCRQWGRAHYTDTTAVFCLQDDIGSEVPEARLFVVSDGQIHQRKAKCEEQRFRRDRLGIKFPTRLSFLTDDNIRLRIKPVRLFDSSFYNLRFLSEMTLMLRDGKPRKTIGITEYLAPKNMKYRLFRWVTDLKIGKDGRGPILRKRF